MDTVVLQRGPSTDQGTFGNLVTERGFRCFTGELPWRENAPSISSVPEGEYIVKATWSPRFKRKMYLLFDVPKRSGIRKHAANFMGDAKLSYRCQLNGCIALGEKLGVMGGQRALLVSVPAMRRFESHMGMQPFRLIIKNAGSDNGPSDHDIQ
jgi:hypothetical protein